MEAIDTESEGSASIFNWSRDNRLWMHFSAFMLFSFLIHGAGFYLFKVVYPSPVRGETKPGSVTILNPSDPAVRSLMQRVSDRTVFLFPPSNESQARVGIDLAPVRFTPAFQNLELDLKAMPEYGDSSTLWEDSKAIPIALRDKSTPLEIQMEGPLKKRGIAPWSIMRDYLQTAEGLPNFRSHVEVSKDGKVKVLELVGEFQEEDRSDLATVLEFTLRFLPGQNATQGWVDVRTEAESRPGENGNDRTGGG